MCPAFAEESDDGLLVDNRLKSSALCAGAIHAFAVTYSVTEVCREVSSAGVNFPVSTLVASVDPLRSICNTHHAFTLLVLLINASIPVLKSCPDAYHEC